jgi:hypothetical protein
LETVRKQIWYYSTSVCEILGSHVDEYEYESFLGCSAYSLVEVDRSFRGGNCPHWSEDSFIADATFWTAGCVAPGLVWIRLQSGRYQTLSGIKFRYCSQYQVALLIAHMITGTYSLFITPFRILCLARFSIKT